jgi:hypothetical protein
LPHALERLLYHWQCIPDERKEEFSAVTGLTKDIHGRLVGTPFPFQPTDSNSLEIRFKYKVRGEKSGFQRTEILRQFRYPQFDGETMIADSLIYHRIALRYKTRYVNEVVQVYHDTPGSWLSNMCKLRARNCRGGRYYYQELINLNYPMPVAALLQGHANYVRSSFHGGVGIKQQLEGARSLAYWLASFPVGYLAYLNDLFQISRTEQRA